MLAHVTVTVGDPWAAEYRLIYTPIAMMGGAVLVSVTAAKRPTHRR